MSLFDPSPYERSVKRRKPRERPKERAVKLIAPWKLLRYRRQSPMAHLLVEPYEIEPTKRPPTMQNGVTMGIPRCDQKHSFPVVEFEGEFPLAPGCPKCLKFAEMNRIPTMIVERPAGES